MLVALLAAALAVATARTSMAQSPEEIAMAREIAGEGLQAYREGDFEKALALFESAKAVYPSAQILRMVGYSQLGLERWQQAAASMEAALATSLAPLGDKDRKDVEVELAKATAHIGVISVKSRVPGAELSVDGDDPRPLPTEQPLRLLEGKHAFSVSAPNHQPRSEEVLVVGGKTVELTLDPVGAEVDVPRAAVSAPARAQPAPDAASPSWLPSPRTFGFVAGGTGLALIGASVVTAVLAADLRGTVEDDVAIHEDNFGTGCEIGGYENYRFCTYDRAIINADADRADALRDASVGLGIAGGVLLAGGAALVLLFPDEPSAPARTGHAASRALRASCAPLLGISSGHGGLACTGAF